MYSSLLNANITHALRAYHVKAIAGWFLAGLLVVDLVVSKTAYLLAIIVHLKTNWNQTSQRDCNRVIFHCFVNRTYTTECCTKAGYIYISNVFFPPRKRAYFPWWAREYRHLIMVWIYFVIAYYQHMMYNVLKEYILML